MAEILFYHLTRSTMEDVLPGLVEKSVGRGWNAVIQSGSADRIAAIDNLLWTYRDESFLAHGAQRDGTEHLQPVWLTTGEDNPNGAEIRFLLDDGALDDPEPYERFVYLFDGHDNTSLAHARNRWKFHKEKGHEITYWQQSDFGSWEKKA